MRKRSKAQSASKNPLQRRLHYEPLEDRQMLAITVDTLVDEFDGSTTDGDVSLRDAIHAANASPGHDTIEFDASLSGGTIEFIFFGELQISEALTIDATALAENVTIDATGDSRIFNIEASTGDFTLAGLTLTGGRTTADDDFALKIFSGGAIRSMTSGTLTLSETLLSGNSTLGREANGGGIFALGDVMLNLSTITDNRTYGGLAHGGGLYTYGNLSVNESTISDNHTVGDFADGGGIYTRGDAILSQSSVSGNRSDGGGGGMHVWGNVTLTTTIVLNNHITGSGNGGGVWSGGNVFAAESTFSDNSSTGWGGAISSYGDVSLSASVVSNNSAVDGSGGGIEANGDVIITASTVSVNSATGVNGRGGGVRANGNVSLTRSTLSGNQSTDRGGGVYAYERVTLTESTVSGNHAIGTHADGGGLFARGDVAVSLSTISGNSATDDGGGILSFGDITITQSTITENSADYGSGGGVLQFQPDQHIFSIEGSIISGNTATYAADVALNGSGNLTINYSMLTLSPNRSYTGTGNIITSYPLDPLLAPLADNGGPTWTHALLEGSLALNAGDPLIEFDPMEFDQRGAPFARVIGHRVDMGAYEDQTLYPEPRSLIVTTELDVVDEFDYLTSLREAILFANFRYGADTITFVSPLFDSAQTIAIASQLPTITDALTIIGPGADLLTIDAGNGTDNTFNTQDGYRIFQIDDGDINNQIDVAIVGLTLTGADVGVSDFSGKGGAIFNRENLTLVSSTLSGNSAADQGGGIWNSGSATFTSSTLTGNSARFGGGIYNYFFGSAMITDSTLTGNSAAHSGGGMFNRGTSVVTYSTLSENSALSGGGGILNTGNLVLTNSILSGNSAAFQGGGTTNYGTATVTNCTFLENSAAVKGGGISNFYYSSVTITDSIFSENTSANQGGGIWNGGTATVANSTLTGNSAAVGGGIYNSSYGSAMMITDSTLTGNTADFGGGGISNNGTATVENSTLSGNSAAKGGGIFNRGTLFINYSTIAFNSAEFFARNFGGGGLNNYYGTSAVLDHVIIANNFVSGEESSDDVTGTVESYWSLVEDYFIAIISGENNLLGIDPLLGPLQDNGGPTLTHALLAGSPAIDAGDPAFTSPPDYDQRGAGYNRISNGRIDIGAFEVQAANTSGDFDADGDVDGRDFLRWQRGQSFEPMSSEDLLVWQEQYGWAEEPIPDSELLLAEFTSQEEALQDAPQQLFSPEWKLGTWLSIPVPTGGTALEGNSRNIIASVQGSSLAIEKAHDAVFDKHGHPWAKFDRFSFEWESEEVRSRKSQGSEDWSEEFDELVLSSDL